MEHGMAQDYWRCVIVVYSSGMRSSIGTEVLIGFMLLFSRFHIFPSRQVEATLKMPTFLINLRGAIQAHNIEFGI